MRDESIASTAARALPAPSPRVTVHPLRRFRTQRKLSMECVAVAVGVSKATISRIETGRQTPTLGIVERLIDFSEGALSADSFLSRRRRARK
jgi:transcriptional regulator with XRE-family HTH domain